MSPLRYRKKFWIVLALATLVLLAGSGGITAYFVRYTATSESSCKQCHPELTELWKKSNGCPANQTKCYECHSRIQKSHSRDWNLIRKARDHFIPPEYLADDEVTSQRCLDCHADVLNFGYTVKKKVIKFTHRFHDEEGLICVDCHRTAGHEYMTGSTNRPTIEECLPCHRREFEGPPQNQKCLNCHEVMMVPGKMYE